MRAAHSICRLHRELLTLVQRGASVDHMPGRHDDWANAAAGVLTLVNPDIGAGQPAILTFYERQVATAVTQLASCSKERRGDDNGYELAGE